MEVHKCLSMLIIFISIEGQSCWDVLATMGGRDPHAGYVFKNEYIFGDCKRNKTLYERVHRTMREVGSTSIFRGWLWYTYRIPTCIIVRASTYNIDAYRLTKYNFEICVPRVTFCYNRRRYNYYYYEWYIPIDVADGSDWDIYFYGPNIKDWTDH